MPNHILATAQALLGLLSTDNCTHNALRKHLGGARLHHIHSDLTTSPAMDRYYDSAYAGYARAFCTIVSPTASSKVIMSARAIGTGVIMGTLVLFLIGCSGGSLLEESLQGKVTDLQIHNKGDEHVVVIEDGNLVDLSVYSSIERLIALEDFINRYKADFGIAASDSLQFVSLDPEFDFQFGEKLLTAVPLHQSIDGIRILDREQLGVFDLESGALRAVQIHVTDPASLRGISVPKRTDNIDSLAVQFLEAQGIVCTDMTALEGPAFSLAVGMVGFEVRCVSKANMQYFTRINLLVNTDSGKVVLRSKEEIDVAQ